MLIGYVNQRGYGGQPSRGGGYTQRRQGGGI
jgi:hypothetical protein